MAHILLLLMGTVPISPDETWGRSPFTVVVCAIKKDPAAREYRLQQSSTGTWEIGIRSTKTRDQWVTLALPGAAPVLNGERVRLSYKSANGGRIVEWTVAPGGNSLDVYVSYELEVNVDTTLAPEIDLLNTDGARRDLDCRVTIHRPQ